LAAPECACRRFGVTAFSSVAFLSRAFGFAMAAPFQQGGSGQGPGGNKLRARLKPPLVRVNQSGTEKVLKR
jgi:hypothetical protein